VHHTCHTARGAYEAGATLQDVEHSTFTCPLCCFSYFSWQSNTHQFLTLLLLL
jgi:hypothetical protein